MYVPEPFFTVMLLLALLGLADVAIFTVKVWKSSDDKPAEPADGTTWDA